jgi:succinate dehydrogenase/fumarate reductase flavoprotein subunit
MAGPIPHPTTPPSNEGDGQIMGMEVGAATAHMDMSICLPTIHFPGEESEGKPLYRSITGNLGKPGDIVVNRHGKRCCDESFFPDMGPAFSAYDTARAELANVPMFWIMDQSFRDKYPVGPLPAGKDMADWLHRANTLEELAEQLGLPLDNLNETVERFNTFARDGYDRDFHRGERSFERWDGDPNNKPNPCLASLEKPPFYGIEIHLGTVGHRGGLVTNVDAQVMNVRGGAIPGLYGAGNTAAHLAVGFGYTSGVANALSMLAGYMAARHMASGE